MPTCAHIDEADTVVAVGIIPITSDMICMTTTLILSAAFYIVMIITTIVRHHGKR